MTSAFFLNEGVFIERLANGDIRLVYTQNDKLAFDIRVPREKWVEINTFLTMPLDDHPYTDGVKCEP